MSTKANDEILPGGLIATHKLAIILDELRKGLSLRKACRAARIDPSALRWLRTNNYTIRRRVDETRIRGLRDRAARCRYVASTLRDARVPMLLARAEGLEKRAAKIE